MAQIVVEITIVLLILAILGMVIPAAVFKLIAYGLVVIWALSLVGFGLIWAYFHYKDKGGIAKW